MKIKNQIKKEASKEVIERAAEQWLNLMIMQLRHKYQFQKAQIRK